MDQTVTCILLLLGFSASFCKYVHIESKMNWLNAQSYCRQHYTDMAPVSNSLDMCKLLELVMDSNNFYWIGLVRNSTDSEKWTWSGGAGVTTFFWAQGQPENRYNEDYGLFQYNSWHDGTPNSALEFLCYKVVVVREKKTWEEALEYCREHHQDLASVASETEMMLIKKELSKDNTTSKVWIGLHFFPGRWLWVDGQPLKYEAWSQKEKPECPEVKLECAALEVKEETQEANSRVSTPGGNSNELTEGANEGSNEVNIDSQNLLGSSSESNAAGCAKDCVWEAHDCEKRLYFLCY